MDARLSLFVIVAMAATMGMLSTAQMAVAQADPVPYGEDGEHAGEYKDGEHKDGTCPFKDRKSASANAGLNI